MNKEIDRITMNNNFKNSGECAFWYFLSPITIIGTMLFNGYFLARYAGVEMTLWINGAILICGAIITAIADEEDLRIP